MINRYVYLGELVDATMGFFDDVGNPILTTEDVIVVVSDINGDFVVSGVGTYSAGDNLYHFSFTMPEDVLLSTDQLKYTINWLLVDDASNEYSSSEYFDVRHPSWDEISSKEIQLLGLTDSDTSVSQALDVDTSVTLEVRFNEVLIDSILTTKGPEFNGYFVYSATIPKESLSLGRNLLLWKYNNSVFHKILNIIDFNTLLFISDLRMYLDKVHKDVDLYVGYRDSDLSFYINEGLSLLNMITPITSWKLHQFNQNGDLFTIKNILILASAYNALTSQYLAEGDSAFDYNGQPVTLAVDRTQYIDTIKSQIWDMLNSQFKDFKKNHSDLNQTFGLSIPYPGVNGFSNTLFDYRYRGIPLRPLTRRY